MSGQSQSTPIDMNVDSKVDMKVDMKIPSKFDDLVKRHELKEPVVSQLKNVLATCKIVLLCDDSSSMGNTIAEEGTDPFAPKKSTRWLELKKLAAVIIEYVTAANPDGLDIHFLNRDSKLNVTDMTGLQSVFLNPPDGSTPLIARIKNLHASYKDSLNGKQLLLVVITDGEPSDGSHNDLYYALRSVTIDGNVHVSFAECTDQEDDMEYLDRWDGLIKNFDNTDDYREELRKVKNIQGQSFKFDYNDYVVKILLATFVKWYYNLDQQNRSEEHTSELQSL
jgi:hypothetical protein